MLPKTSNPFTLLMTCSIYLCASCVAAAMMAGCTSDHNSNPIDPAANPATVKNSDTRSGKGLEEDRYIQSQSLTDEGEALLRPLTLRDAGEKFRQAIETDPTNARARFWQAWLKPAEALKGIVSRIKPFYYSLEEGPTRYALLLDKLTAESSIGTRRFLTDGPEDISSVDELQNFVDLMVIQLADLRNFLRDNKNAEIRVRAIPDFLSAEPETSTTCETTRFGPISMDLGYCNSARDVLLNRADFETLQQAVAAYQGYLIVMNAYRLNPKFVSKIWETASNPLTNGDISLLVEQGFGGLRASNGFTAFRGLMKDLKVAVYYYLQNQAITCKHEHFTNRNRTGYLFKEGICDFRESGMSSALQRTTDTIEKILVGAPIDAKAVGAAHASSSKWTLLPLRLVDHPPATLGFVVGVRKNECGDSQAILDDSAFRPYFTRGTVTDFVNETNRCDTDPARSTQ